MPPTPNYKEYCELPTIDSESVTLSSSQASSTSCVIENNHDCGRNIKWSASSVPGAKGKSGDHAAMGIGRDTDVVTNDSTCRCVARSILAKEHTPTVKRGSRVHFGDVCVRHTVSSVIPHVCDDVHTHGQGNGLHESVADDGTMNGESITPEQRRSLEKIYRSTTRPIVIPPVVMAAFSTVLIALCFAIVQYRIVSLLTYSRLTIYYQLGFIVVLAASTIVVYTLKLCTIDGLQATKQHATMVTLSAMLVFSFIRDYWHPSNSIHVKTIVIDNPSGNVLPKTLLGFSKALTAVLYGCLAARFIPFLDVYVLSCRFKLLCVSLASFSLILPSLMGTSVTPRDLESYMHNFIASLTIAVLLREYVLLRTKVVENSGVVSEVAELAEIVSEVVPAVIDARKQSSSSRKFSAVELVVEDNIHRRLSAISLRATAAHERLKSLPKSDANYAFSEQTCDFDSVF